MSELKVIAAVAAIGIAVYALGVAAGAVPLLVLAVCPLSMLLMMRAMGSMGSRTSERETGDRDEVARLRAGLTRGTPTARASRRTPCKHRSWQSGAASS